MSIYYLIAGIFFCGFVGFFWLKFYSSKSEKENFILHEKIEQYLELVEEQKTTLANKEETIIQLNRQLSKRESDLEHLNQKLTDQKNEIQKLQEQFRLEFKNLANDILENNSKKFGEDNRNKLNDILKPLGEKIKDFEKKVEETYDKESKLRFSLKEEIKRLEELNQQVSKDTENLTKALKGDSKTQGDWGEVVLENILEKSGLIRDQEYFIQQSYIVGNDGTEKKRLQPDVVIKYPGKRNVIIDSKVSLTAYNNYISAENEEEKESAFKAHILSIKNHIKELSAKNYQDLYDLNSLDFVMMFLPVEPAYLLTIQKEPNIWNQAYTDRILIISPTNLIAALKMIESLWRQEYQTRNVQEIARQSGELYDKFAGFVDDLLLIGKKIQESQTIYEESMKKISTGKGNLVKRVQNIKKLGVKTKRELPQDLITKAEED